MKCNAKPYNECEPYIFFSYCHKDKAVVYPIIEQMVKDGYRIWYDEGIHPGADWPEMIAARLNDCNICICAISSSAVQSHSCRNELTFALENHKTTLTIMLEDFTMPLGMRLQLANTQIIKGYEYPGSALFKKIYMSNALEVCLGEKQDIEVHHPSETQHDDDVPISESTKDAMHELRNRLENVHDRNEADDLAAEEAERLRLEKERKAAEEAERLKNEDSVNKFISVKDDPVTQAGSTKDDLHNADIPEEADDEKCTVLDTYTSGDDLDSEESNTVIEGKIIAPVMLHFNTLHLYNGEYPMTSVGRSRKKNDIVLSGFATISSHHLDLIIYKKHNYVLDRGSANGTKLNGEVLRENVRAEIVGCAELSLASERFLVAFDQSADFIRQNRTVAVLKSYGTREKKYLFGDDLILGRSFKWPGGAMSDEKISRKHAVLSFENGNYYLKDISANGTYVNKKRLPKDEPILLTNGDDIRIGAEHFAFMQWLFGEEDNEQE